MLGQFLEGADVLVVGGGKAAADVEEVQLVEAAQRAPP